MESASPQVIKARLEVLCALGCLEYQKVLRDTKDIKASEPWLMDFNGVCGALRASFPESYGYDQEQVVTFDLTWAQKILAQATPELITEIKGLLG